MKKPKNAPVSNEQLLFNIKFVENIIRPFYLNEIDENEVIGNFSGIFRALQDSTELQQSLLIILKNRQAEITEELTREINSRVNLLLTSFDWDINWIMGNSSLSTHRYQLATLILNCRNKLGESENINFEVNYQQLDELIKLLESSNMVCV